MPHADATHDLEALIQSRHPIVTIDTVEEERVDNILQSVASTLHMLLFTWTVTHGLQRVGGEGAIYGTGNPQMLVRHLATLTVRGVFHLKDLHVHLKDATVVRGLRDTAQAFLRSGSTAVLSGESIHLPGELAREAIPFVLHLPDRLELQQVVHQILRSLKRQHDVAVTLGPDGMESLLQALSGLTLNQARQAVAWAVLDDNALTTEDIPRVLRRKCEAVREEGLLEFHPPEDNTFELGGFDRLKAWLERARVGFTSEARALDRPAPRGLLIVGVQGCGKSLAAKAIAGAWKQPLLKLDAARLYDKFIGESEKNLRKALDFAEAIAPSILWMLRHQDPSKFDLRALTAASEGFSGAEIEQAIIAGLYRALHDRQALTTAMLCEEMRGTQPLSVSRREDVERLREMARGRFVPV